MTLNLVDFRDPILYKPTIPFDFENPPVDPKELTKDLKEALLRIGGLGLSANQVGVPYSVFVFGNPGDPNSIISMFNAKIVFHHGEDIEMVEGCLSIPGLAVKITRPAKVRVRFTDEEGKTSTLEFSGISARVIQHEMCHMRGEPFFRGLSKLKLERAIKHTEKTTGKVYRYSDLYKLMNG